MSGIERKKTAAVKANYLSAATLDIFLATVVYSKESQKDILSRI